MLDRCPKCGKRGFQSCVAPCAACGWNDEPLGDWVPSGRYADPANPGKSRYWEKTTRQWSDKPSSTEGSPIPPKPFDWAAVTEGALASVGSCLVMGGHNVDHELGASVLLCFRDDVLEVWSKDTTKVSYAYRDITELEVESPPVDEPSQDNSLGALLAGGFAATMEVDRLNRIIAATARLTLVRIATDSMELFVHATADRPLALRIRLSPVRHAIRAAAARA